MWSLLNKHGAADRNDPDDEGLVHSTINGIPAFRWLVSHGKWIINNSTQFGTNLKKMLHGHEL